MTFNVKTIKALFKFLHMSLARYTLEYPPHHMDFWWFVTPEEIIQEATIVLQSNKKLAQTPLTGRGAAQRISIIVDHFTIEQIKALETLPHSRMSKGDVFHYQFIIQIIGNVLKRHGHAATEVGWFY